jgi:hypothetical protein
MHGKQVSLPNSKLFRPFQSGLRNASNGMTLAVKHIKVNLCEDEETGPKIQNKLFCDKNESRNYRSQMGYMRRSRS